MTTRRMPPRAFDDAWDWDEHADDEWQDESAPVPSAFPRPGDLDWDWSEEVDDEWHLDEFSEDEFQQPPRPSPEDAWDWHEEVDDEWWLYGRNATVPFVYLQPRQCWIVQEAPLNRHVLGASLARALAGVSLSRRVQEQNLVRSVQGPSLLRTVKNGC